MSVLKWTMPRLRAMARRAQARVLALGRVGERTEMMVGRNRGKDKKAMKGQR
jgi:hypothetical protein